MVDLEHLVHALGEGPDIIDHIGVFRPDIFLGQCQGNIARPFVDLPENKVYFGHSSYSPQWKSRFASDASRSNRARCSALNSSRQRRSSSIAPECVS